MERAGDDPYVRTEAAIREPPVGLWATLRNLGPGLIITGSIVGSGELILTTHLGAQVGFAFLWFILLGCVIKVFVQIEMGRHTISSGETALEAFNRVPGPRRWGASWIVWWWVLMVITSFVQLGGIVDGLGQALQISLPAERIGLGSGTIPFGVKGWTAVACLSGMILLYRGRYRFVQTVTTLMVFFFTTITVICTVALQWTEYAVTREQLLGGLRFSIPQAGVGMAFAAFGIIGMGASELIYYPYWCLEKGYARFVGPESSSPDWARRARQWVRVLQADAWLSLVVYTISTVAFYILGAAVLNARSRLPEKGQMIAVLSDMYVQTLGAWGMAIFLLGAVAVLYSTFFVATASNARVIADGCQVVGLVRFESHDHRRRWVGRLCLLLPVIYYASFLIGKGHPVLLVSIGAFVQAITLPVIAGATIYLRYRRTDKRLQRRTAADVMLWLAAIGMLAVSVYKVGTILHGLIAGKT